MLVYLWRLHDTLQSVNDAADDNNNKGKDNDDDPVSTVCRVYVTRCRKAGVASFSLAKGVSDVLSVI